MFITDFISRLHQAQEHVFMLTQMICAWFIQHYADVDFSFYYITGKRSSCWKTAPAIFVIRKFFRSSSQLSRGATRNQSFLQLSFSTTPAKWEESQKQERSAISRSRCGVGPRSSPSIRGGVKMREWDGAWGVAVGCLHCTPLLQMDSRGVLHIKHCSLSRNL